MCSLDNRHHRRLSQCISGVTAMHSIQIDNLFTYLLCYSPVSLGIIRSIADQFLVSICSLTRLWNQWKYCLERLPITGSNMVIYIYIYIYIIHNFLLVFHSCYVSTLAHVVSGILPDIGQKSRIVLTVLLNASLRVNPSEIKRKLEWWGYYGENRFHDTVSCFDRAHRQRDRRIELS